MKRIGKMLAGAALIGAIVTLGVSTALAQADTWGIQIREPFTMSIDNPCTAETILIEGRFLNVIHVTQNDTGYHDFSLGPVIDATGIGLETNEGYRFLNSGGQVDYGMVDGLSVTNYEVIFLVVSDGASPNFLFHSVFKLTIDADWQPDLEVMSDMTRCTP